MITNYALFPNELSSKFCDLICETAYQYKEQEATLYKQNTINKDFRSSSIRWINQNKHPEINFILNAYANNENLKSFGFDISYGPGAFQYTEYKAETSDHFNWHIDSLYDNNFISDRKLTLCILLNDPSEYEGGVFCLDNVQPKFDPEKYKQKGSMIIFPSYCRHCVTKVTKGIRKSLVIWYNGPRFR